MKSLIVAPAALLAVFLIGLSSSLFLLPFWVDPFITATQSKNPADWIGFAGNFAAGIMTLIAAIIAWFAVQTQIKAQRDIEERKETDAANMLAVSRVEAKLAAVVSVTQPIHAAATMLFAVRKSQRATDVSEMVTWDKATNQATAQVEQTLAHFSIQSIVPEMAIHDRLFFLILVTQLSTIVNIYNRPPGILSRGERLGALHANLVKLSTFLKPFDEELAAVFERDGIKRAL
jgi:hypothetical protein